MADDDKREWRRLITAGLTGGADVLVALIESFGWPGAIALIAFWRLDSWASDTQKERMVEIYILGNGLLNVWPMFVVGGIVAITIWLQRYRDRKVINTLRREIDRMGAEKSALQEQLAARPLQHGRKR